MTFFIYTLGCKVNFYESNFMKEAMIKAGFNEITDKNTSADIYIINTCTVTNTSDNKSLKTIRHLKRNNPNAIIVVTGCMSQVNSDKLNGLGINIIIGNKHKSKIADLIKQYIENNINIELIEDIQNTNFESMCINNFQHTRAFVKIEDGCENYCSYCIIPYARGKVRSKDKDEILEEINNLINSGHEEIVLTGIHTGHYGSDLKNYNFANLLNEIITIDGLKRLRISSIEINEITDEVLAILKKTPIIVDHLHIPIQSGSDRILKDMNRKYNKQQFANIVQKIRDIRPNISLTTDIIVGFPGETDLEFQETIETIKKIKFSKIHVFPFSLRKGTKAEQLPNHIDEVTKKRRVKELITISQQLEIDYAKKFLNQVLEFIPETYYDGYLTGHTGNYLLLKTPGNIKDLHKSIKAKLIKIEYPYIICEKKNLLK